MKLSKKKLSALAKTDRHKCPCGTEYARQCNWLWCERCEAEALANYVDAIFANGEARLLAFEFTLDRLKLWGKYWRMVSRVNLVQ